MKLKIASTLTLPLKTVTQAIGILAKRRAGKSYTARRLAEQLFTAGQQIVIVDPKGDWWGIRSSADGKKPGLPVVIIGGERGDVKLETGAGEVVAKLVVEERVSALLDLSLLRKHEVATFMTAFLETLYRLKAREQFRTPMMLLIDEADAIAPQKPQRGEERMLGAAEDIVRRGGQRGVGCTLITQRSAVLNKNVLTQVQVLVALRTIAPQDLGAMDAWIDVHGTAEQRKTLMASLPALPIGEAWVWSPGWPTVAGIFQRVQVLPIETFDSGKSPEPGKKPVEPKNLADVDLEALSRQMAATIERSKAEDPRELRKDLAEAQRMLARQAKTIGELQTRPPAGKEKVVEKPVLKDGQIARAERILGQAEKLAERFSEFEEDLRVTAKEIRDAIRRTHERPLAKCSKCGDVGPADVPHLCLGRGRAAAPAPVPTRQPRTSSAAAAAPRSDAGGGPPRRTIAPSNGSLPPAKQKILNGLAFLHGIGVAPADKTQLALMVGVSPTSGGYFNNLGALRSEGLIEYPVGGTVSLTEAGHALASTAGVPSTTAELHDAIRAKLPPAKWRILEALIAAYPRPMSKDALAEQIGVSPTSGGYFNNLGSLRSLGLVDYPQPGTVAVQPVLFLEASR